MNQPKSRLRIVIIGGVAGGASAAARARRANSDAEITVLEKGPVISFANCGLPYHIGGEIEQRDKLLVATPELFWNRFRIRVRNGHEVTKIDRQACTVTGKKADGEEFKVPYDRLILAVGSEPIRPSFFETKGRNVFQLWTLEDMDRILEYMKQHPCRRAVVVGAGFIGLEVVEQLARLDIKVTVVEKGPQILSPIDPELAKIVKNHLEDHKVKVLTGEEVKGFLASQGHVTAVKLSNGDSVAADLVIVGVGVRPRTELAEQSGIELGEHAGIKVNEFCQTSDPNVYAVGDASEYAHGVLKQATMNPLAGPANRSGRIAGEHAATGNAKPMGSVLGTSIVRVFDLGVAATGCNTQTCVSHGIAFRTATIQAPHHASYFPGAKSLTLKLLYSPEDGRVLGAQSVGPEGIDKRIDVIATAIQFGATVDDLANLDLTYAPPFGSAKDPVHMVAFVAQNDLAGHPTLANFDVDLEGIQVVDVRTDREIEQLPLTGAVHIPIDELPERWEELDPSRPTITVCHSGKRAHVAACWLRGKEFANVTNMNGGMSIRHLLESSSKS